MRTTKVLTYNKRIKDLELLLFSILRPGDSVDIPDFKNNYFIFLANGSFNLEYEDKIKEYKAPFVIIPEQNKSFKIVSKEIQTNFCFINVLRDKENNLLSLSISDDDIEKGMNEGEYRAFV